MATSAAIAVVGAVAGYGAYETREARKNAEEEAKRQAELAEQQAAEQRKAREQAPTDADSAAARQRRRGAAGVSRSDTILTGPLGAQGAAPTARKTLLGD